MININKLKAIITQARYNAKTDEDIELVDAASQELKELKKNLKEIEWVWNESDGIAKMLVCPACNCESGKKHKIDCWLNNTINAIDKNF